MNQADLLFIENINEILNFGHSDENPRPKYKSDGKPAYSLYITQVFEKYDIGSGQFPITTLRPIAINNGIKEIQWIYQDQNSNLSRLEGQYGIMWWRDWEVGDSDTIGLRYGATVERYDLMNKLLKGLKQDPFSRRHILSLWQDNDLESEGLNPCAFQTIFTVRKVDDKMFLDMTLIQRSSDYLVAGHINKMQYVAFMMMIAKHLGYEYGVFAHFVQNLHIYDRHVVQARELLDRTPSTHNPMLKLNVTSGTNFYDITYEDFEMIYYEPVKPQLKFDLGV